jgi:hypothetical protein
MDTEPNKTTGPKELKTKRDSPPRRSPQEIPQRGAQSSGVPLRGPAATSEPAGVISAKGRDEPMVKPGTSLLGGSGTNTPLQGASISGLPAVGELGHLVSGVGGIRLVKKALSGCARQKLKKKKKSKS